MITLNVFFDVDTAHLDEFLALLNDMVVKSSAEEGNSYYHLLADKTQANRYSLIEHWENQTALLKLPKATRGLAHSIYKQPTLVLSEL